MSPYKTLGFFIPLVLLITSAFTYPAYADGHSSNAQSAIEKAVASDIRSEQEKARDTSRKPVEALKFFGLEEDMRVLELVPGSGWYTKILNEVVKNKGQLYVAISTRRLNFDEPWLQGVQVAGSGYAFERADAPGYVANLSEGSFEVKNLDMVLTFRNVHNLTVAARNKLNADVYDALAPGGIYGVIGHTKRHMVPGNAEIWRRTDPVQIIKEALDAGFEFEAYSNIHYRPADELVFDSQHESIKGDSDRFTLKFRKPE